MDTTRGSLLIRVRDAKNADAWREFDTIYRPMLRRFARSCGLGETDAEDLTQNCMVTIHQHISSFEYDPKKGRFKGWLRTLVNNRIRNLMRNRREHAAESGDFRREQLREEDPAEHFDEIWMEEHLRHCLRLVRADVEPKTFQVFRRHVLDERSVEEVSEEFGVTANQVYKAKWRLTQKVSERMKGLLEGGE